MYREIKRFSEDISKTLIEIRRDFHKYAETGWLEFRTSSIVARELDNLGFQVKIGKEVLDDESRMGLPDAATLEKHWQRAKDQGGDPEYLKYVKGGFTGVAGILELGEGHVTALRFDMDALEIVESQSTEHIPYKENFSSVNTGMMHACGHDTHTATGLGIARFLSNFKDYLSGTVILIFQPAEEGVRGAKSMVASGLLDNVDYLLGHHVYPGWAVGEIVPGMGDYAATEKFDAFIKGNPSHAGGRPESGKNAMLAAATAITNLYAIPRHSAGSTRINVGKIIAGSGRNVICPNAHLTIETRGETNQLSDYMREKAEQVLKAAAQMYNCELEIVDMGSAITGESDKEMSDLVIKTATKLDNFSIISSKGHGGGSEDFTYMMKAVQDHGGKATNIGIGADLHNISSFTNNRSNVLEPHTFNFDINEQAINKAVYLLSSVLYNLMKK